MWFVHYIRTPNCLFIWKWWCSHVCLQVKIIHHEVSQKSLLKIENRFKFKTEVCVYCRFWIRVRNEMSRIHILFLLLHQVSRIDMDFKSKTNLTWTLWLNGNLWYVSPVYIWSMLAPLSPLQAMNSFSHLMLSKLRGALTQHTTLWWVSGDLQMLAKGRGSGLYSKTRTNSA